MGKVSTYIITVGLVFLLPAIALTVLFFYPQKINESSPWIINVLKAVALGALYALGLAFVGLGLLILKRDTE